MPSEIRRLLKKKKSEEGGDSAVTAGTLIEVFSGLPNIEELVLDVGKDVM
ncbi:hypothetical protein ARALYDRAFT_915939 [Arabidopsis lyrata subsp. lyrata]|uniref:Uncharacterized protein n=1 Tax=Arabidopsis lyrata subsp. lyrata TaxID=81972 RepID=D7MII6_ARALL|nr:hypothetical protein ARALYDRAFT_915939 [Arabidopsis lyrata subsp. lyrata]